MSKKPSAAYLKRENARLALENSALSKRSQLLEGTISNSLGGLTNGLIGLNGPFQDNITSFNPGLNSNVYGSLTLMYTDLIFLYRTHGILQTAIDMPVLDALRDGLELVSDQLDASDLSAVDDYIEDTGVMDRISDATCWSRLFGGAALIINSDDAECDQPLEQLGPDNELEFYDACRWELMCARRLPESGKYGFYGRTLDKSRVLTLLGKRAPYIIRQQLADWGVSEIERMSCDFNMYLRSRNVMYDLLNEAKTDVFSFRGFSAQLATSTGTQLTQKRVQSMNAIKNFNNSLILDSEDKYEQKQISFGGLAEMSKEARIMVASALRMPMTKLFGMGSTGFSSGEDDMENYAALVTSEVRGPLRPLIRKVLKLVVWKLFGDRDLDIDFKWKPLRILNAEQEESIKTSKSTRYLSMYNALLMDSKEVGEAMTKDGLVPIAIKAEQGLLDDHPISEAGQVQGQPAATQLEGDEVEAAAKQGKAKANPPQPDEPDAREEQEQAPPSKQSKKKDAAKAEKKNGAQSKVLL